MNPKRLLTEPGKMPGFSFSLPAGDSCPASKVANKLAGDQSTCFGCYAKSGNYLWPAVRQAQQDRFDFVRESLRTDKGKAFVDLMVSELTRRVKPTDPYFRIHDSGDLFSPAYANAWYQICKALPWIQFWCPTREWIRSSMLASLRKLNSLPNVVVRPSALRVNDPAPVVAGLAAGTQVTTEATPNACPSTATKEKHCDDHGCRACWTADKEVAYVVHGMKAKQMQRNARELPQLENV